MLTARTLWVPIVIVLFFAFLLTSQPVIGQTSRGTATVSDIVEDEPSGAPLNGIPAPVRVSGNNDDSDRTGFTDTLGRYFFRDGDPLELTNRNVITASESLEAEVQIEGVVTSDATGLPMWDVIIRVYDADKQLVYETDTDGSGAYSVSGLSTACQHRRPE